jgi:alpha-tubulin suppressor-like RCC1 family protein
VIVYGKKLLSIACGSKHVLALDVDGKVYSWGKNDVGQVKIPKQHKFF